MDNFFAELLLLDEDLLQVLLLALIPAGGFLGACGFEIKHSIRRVTYFGIFALMTLLLNVSQIGWAFIGPAADAGFFSLTVFLLMGSFSLFGCGLYCAAAARSNDIMGNTSRAWIAFIPFANLWLFFKPGAKQPGASMRPVGARYAADPLIVIGSLVILMAAQILAQVLEEGGGAYSAGDSAELSRVLSNAQTVEESFAREASLMQDALPVEVDEITVLEEIEAVGDTISFFFRVGQAVQFRSDFQTTLAGSYCRTEMFGEEIDRGGKVRLIYLGPNTELLGSYTIQRSNCEIF